MITLRSFPITEWDSVPMAGGRAAIDTGGQSPGAAPVTTWTDETGATAVEYGLVTVAVGIAFIVAGPMLLDALVAFLGIVLDHMPGVSNP